MAKLPTGFGRTPVKSIIPITTEEKGVFVELSLLNWQGLLQPLIQGLAASHNGRHINLQMSSGKLKCQRFSQQHQGPARGIIDWFTFCLEPNIHPGGQKQEAKQKMKEHLLQAACADAIHLFSFKNNSSFRPIFYRPLSAHVIHTVCSGPAIGCEVKAFKAVNSRCKLIMTS